MSTPKGYDLIRWPSHSLPAIIERERYCWFSTHLPVHARLSVHLPLTGLSHFLALS